MKHKHMEFIDMDVLIVTSLNSFKVLLIASRTTMSFTSTSGTKYVFKDIIVHYRSCRSILMVSFAYKLLSTCAL